MMTSSIEVISSNENEIQSVSQAITVENEKENQEVQDLSINHLESLLKNLGVSSFQSFSDSTNLSLKKRVLNSLMTFYLILEMTKMSCWVVLPQEHHLTLMTGSYFYILGRSGKLIYLAILSCTFNAVLSRLGFFLKEKSRELDYLLDPINFLRQNNTNQCVHEIKFRKTFHDLFKLCRSEIYNSSVMTNLFVLVCVIRGAIKTGEPYYFILGMISHVFHSVLFGSGCALASFQWKTCLAFIDMKMDQLLERMDLVLTSDTKSNKDHFINRILEDLKNLRIKVLKYNQVLMIFLFASIASTTPITTTLVYTSIFDDDSHQGILLQVIHFPILFIFTFQGWSPCYLTTKIWTKSMMMHKRLNSIFVRFSPSLELQTRLSLREEIKSLGSPRPLAISDMKGIPYTPSRFFLYLESCLLTFILLIENFKTNTAGAIIKDAFKEF